MKKILLILLLVGGGIACPSTLFSRIELVSMNSISIEPPLTQIFLAAIPKFASQFGLELSLAALQSGYCNGTVNVAEIPHGSSWQVNVGGDGVIVDFEDFL